MLLPLLTLCDVVARYVNDRVHTRYAGTRRFAAGYAVPATCGSYLTFCFFAYAFPCSGAFVTTRHHLPTTRYHTTVYHATPTRGRYTCQRTPYRPFTYRHLTVPVRVNTCKRYALVPALSLFIVEHGRRRAAVVPLSTWFYTFPPSPTQFVLPPPAIRYALARFHHYYCGTYDARCYGLPDLRASACRSVA